MGDEDDLTCRANTVVAAIKQILDDDVEDTLVVNANSQKKVTEAGGEKARRK